MSEPPPEGSFRFLEWDEFDTFDLMFVHGLCCKCEITYPETLHELHNDNPMAPKHLTVSQNMLSDYTFGLINKFETEIRRQISAVVHRHRLVLLLHTDGRLYKDTGWNFGLLRHQQFQTDTPFDHRVLGEFMSETGSMAPRIFVGLWS